MDERRKSQAAFNSMKMTPAAFSSVTSAESPTPRVVSRPTGHGSYVTFESRPHARETTTAPLDNDVVPKTSGEVSQESAQPVQGLHRNGLLGKKKRDHAIPILYSAPAEVWNPKDGQGWQSAFKQSSFISASLTREVKRTKLEELAFPETQRVLLQYTREDFDDATHDNTYNTSPEPSPFTPQDGPHPPPQHDTTLVLEDPNDFNHWYFDDFCPQNAFVEDGSFEFKATSAEALTPALMRSKDFSESPLFMSGGTNNASSSALYTSRFSPCQPPYSLVPNSLPSDKSQSPFQLPVAASYSPVLQPAILADGILVNSVHAGAQFSTDYYHRTLNSLPKLSTRAKRKSSHISLISPTTPLLNDTASAEASRRQRTHEPRKKARKMKHLEQLQKGVDAEASLATQSAPKIPDTDAEIDTDVTVTIIHTKNGAEADAAQTSELIQQMNSPDKPLVASKPKRSHIDLISPVASSLEDNSLREAPDSQFDDGLSERTPDAEHVKLSQSIADAHPALKIPRIPKPAGKVEQASQILEALKILRADLQNRHDRAKTLADKSGAHHKPNSKLYKEIEQELRESKSKPSLKSLLTQTDGLAGSSEGTRGVQEFTEKIQKWDKNVSQRVLLQKRVMFAMQLEDVQREMERLSATEQDEARMGTGWPAGSGKVK